MGLRDDAAKLSEQYRVIGQHDPLAQLPALAERLGVKEWVDGSGATILLTTKAGTGKSYCVFQLVNAMLDRMDKILPLTRQ